MRRNSANGGVVPLKLTSAIQITTIECLRNSIGIPIRIPSMEEPRSQNIVIFPKMLPMPIFNDLVFYCGRTYRFSIEKKPIEE